MNNDFDNDFLEEEKTPVAGHETMEELMESIRSPGIATLTSDRPTKPMRPIIINNMERHEASRLLDEGA